MNKRTHLILVLLLGVTLLSACGGSPTGGVFVWIDVPLDGLAFPDVQEIKIEGHAAGGVTRVEIWIDGAVLTTITDPPVEGTLANFHTAWMPSTPGTYTIQAVAYGADGSASQPDSARVTFGSVSATPVVSPTLVAGCPTPVGGGPTPVSCPTLVITVTPVITDTPTPVISVTPPPSASSIQFYSYPPEIAAGSCATIYWNVENTQRVVFGGVDQPFSGSYETCLCENQRYTLTVTHLDGTEERRTVDINVTGSCITPEAPPPPQDTTPPPAPSPAVPQNGLTVACKASQSLAWLPVDDPSGIAGYQVEVQRHSGDNNWQAVGGSPFNTGDKTIDVPVECGWYYRWRVRATDGAGNVGPWSGWSQFTVTLT